MDVEQRAHFPFLLPYFPYKSTGEKLLKYQENSPWVIISLILMTSGANKLGYYKEKFDADH